MSYHLGVDVGTTWTAAAIGRDGRAEAVTLGSRSAAVPSVVCRLGARMLVGEPAARRAVTDPGLVAREFKRRVGDPTPLLLGGSPVSAELCMARVVEWVVAQVAATEGGPPAGLTLTHPANWGEYKLDLLRQGLHHVGLTVDRFVPEPVAAATAYAGQRPLTPGSVVAVYDLGGGTFDAALVRAGDSAGPHGPDAAGVHGADGAAARIVGRPDGIERLGGIDFDHAVFRHALAAIGVDLDRLDPDDTRTAAGLAQLREECVEAKEALSHETDVAIPVMLPERHTEVRLTRSELEAMIRPALNETLVALRRTIASADVAVDDVAAVLLVGGSSRIPLVGQLVAGELGRPVAVDARPKDTISLGAARVAMAAARPSVPATAPMVAAAGAPSPPATTERPAAPPPPPVEVPAPAAAPGAAASPGARSRRMLLAVLTTIVVLAGAVGAGLLLTDDEPPAATASDTSDDTTDGTTDDTMDDTTDGAGSDSTGTDGGDDRGSTDVAAFRPLPGDGWSDEARGQFVEDCNTGVVQSQPVLETMVDMDGVCGCVYDDMAGSYDFATFNEQLTSDAVDPSSEFGQQFGNAVLSCSLSTQG